MDKEKEKEYFDIKTETAIVGAAAAYRKASLLLGTAAGEQFALDAILSRLKEDGVFRTKLSVLLRERLLGRIYERIESERESK